MERTRLTSVVVGCKHSVVLTLIRQLGQELTADVGRVNRTDRGGESCEPCIVQSLNKPRNIGSVLSVDKSSCESEENGGEDENHDSGGGWWWRRGEGLEETWGPLMSDNYSR